MQFFLHDKVEMRERCIVVDAEDVDRGVPYEGEWAVVGRI